MSRNQAQLSRLAKNQSGFHLVIAVVAIAVLALVILTLFRITHSGGDKQTDDQSTLTPAQQDSLPDISYFKTHKSDRFLVDLKWMKSGQPFKGKKSLIPHTGGHIDFEDDYKLLPANPKPADYPAIYAPVDGYIYQIDDSFSDTVSGGAHHDEYTIQLAFAKGDKGVYNLGYAIEPFVAEPSPGFYKQFIDVKTGQHVKKGQVLAHMYLQSGESEPGVHIHFHLKYTGSWSNFYAPAIFTPAVVQQFHDHWAQFGRDGISPNNPGTPIPACMGYKVAADENPFGTGALDCLN
jgi:hypothetical protein